jgi:hypothetical protein
MRFFRTMVADRGDMATSTHATHRHTLTFDHFVLILQNNLMRFFRTMVADRGDMATSKKMGLLFLIVHLFKVYFRINNLRLCNNLM